MIGKLKRKEVRTRYDQKIMRVEVDIPYQAVQNEEMDGDDVVEWVESNVGELIGFEFTALEDQDQQTLLEVGDSV
jgi:outer membrane usher protein FimD/PapC